MKQGQEVLGLLLRILLLDIMYEIPSMKNVEKVTITKDAVQKKSGPKLTYRSNSKSA